MNHLPDHKGFLFELKDQLLAFVFLHLELDETAGELGI